GLFDQDLAHRLHSRAEEMPPALPAGFLAPHQPEIRLVDQGRRLEGLAGGQPGRERRGQAAQLLVEDRQQFRRRLLLFGSSLFIGRRHRRRIFRIFDHPAAFFSYESIEATDGNSVSPRGDSAPERRTTATTVNETGRRLPSPQWWADS